MATATSSSSTTKSSGTDIVTNLANLLPTGTFLAFQSIAPLFTNNGNCGLTEKIMTGILIFTFSMITFLLAFTDSITTSSGKHYYGIVTSKGMYNPQFKDSGLANVNGSFYTGDSDRYQVSIFDGINGILGVVVLDALVLLTPPVSTCYYQEIPVTVIKSVPILVGLVVSFYFSFAPPARRGVGYSLTGLVPDPVDDSTVTGSTTAKDAAASATESLLTAAEKKADSAGTSPARSSNVV